MSEEGDKIAGGGRKGRRGGGRKMGARPLQRGRGKRKCNGLLGATGSGEEKKCRIPVFPPYIKSLNFSSFLKLEFPK